MSLKAHLIRVAACLGCAAVAGFLASVLSFRTADAPPPPDLSAMDQSLNLATQLVLNRAEMTLRTVDLQSLLIQEATSGQCSSGARFLLRQAMIENAVVRYAALVQDGRISCQPGEEDETVLQAVLENLPDDTKLILVDPKRSGRANEIALVRFKEEGFASVFWFPVDRLLADPVKGTVGSHIEVALQSTDGVVLVRAGPEARSDLAAVGQVAQSSSYPLAARVSAAALVIPEPQQPSPVWPIASALLAAMIPLVWRTKTDQD